MGQIIRKQASKEQIIGDVRTAYAQGVAQGGKMKDIVEAELAPAIQALDGLDTELTDAAKTALPLVTALKAEVQKATAVVARVYDDTWNDVGRPGADGMLVMLFPDGYSYYTDVEAHALPTQMELLARLFEKGVHKKLSAAQNQAKALQLRESAKAVSDALEAAKLPASNVKLLERMEGVMAKVSHGSLVNAKRVMKNAGFTEAQIHQVIPDRSEGESKGAKGGKKGEAKGESGAAGG